MPYIASIGVLAALIVLVGGLALLNERLGRRIAQAAMRPLPPPVGPGMALTPYRTSASTPPTVRRYDRLRSDVAGAALPAPGGPAAIAIERRQPHREPNMTADVGVPIAQALATAAVAGILAGALGLLAGRADALKLATGAFVITLALAWLWRLGVVTNLLQVVETVTRTDLDGDGQPGDDGHPLLVNPGAARQKAQRAERQREQAAKLADLLTFWRACHVKGTAERAHGVQPGTPQQTAYRAKRDVLLRLGLARWQNEANHNAGWKLTTNEAEAVEILRQHVHDLT